MRCSVFSTLTMPVSVTDNTPVYEAGNTGPDDFSKAKYQDTDIPNYVSESSVFESCTGSNRVKVESDNGSDS